MAVIEGRSPSDRNKLIAALLLGGLALVSLFFAFGPSIGGSSTSVTVSVSPTPRTGSSANRELGPVTMPSRADQDLAYMVPVDYRPGSFGAPPPGRNIFAFYEPPPPCPECPTPTPPPTPLPTPVVTPQLPFEIAGINPQSVYMGSKAFRIEVGGDRFTPDAKIIFNNAELPTAFGGPQRLTATVPAELIAGQGSPSVSVRTPDGKGYSLSTTFLIQAPPKPQFKYVGMIARRLGNNDTAYFEEQGRQTPTGYRLNDVVSGRFRLVNISADRVVLEDVNLGFRHPVELFRPPPGTATTTGPGRQNFPPPGMPQNFPQAMPGIPNNIPRYVPPRRNNANSNSNRPDPDDDEDDDEPQRR